MALCAQSALSRHKTLNDLHKWHWHTDPWQGDWACDKGAQLALWDLRETVCNGTMPNVHGTLSYSGIARLALWDLRKTVCNGTMPNVQDTLCLSLVHNWHCEICGRPYVMAQCQMCMALSGVLVLHNWHCEICKRLNVMSQCQMCPYKNIESSGYWCML